MNAKKLRELLAGVPDDTEVVFEGQDHSYVPVRDVNFVDAEKLERKNQFWQYAGPEHMGFGTILCKVILLQ